MPSYQVDAKISSYQQITKTSQTHLTLVVFIDKICSIHIPIIDKADEKNIMEHMF